MIRVSRPEVNRREQKVSVRTDAETGPAATTAVPAPLWRMQARAPVLRKDIAASRVEECGISLPRPGSQ